MLIAESQNYSSNTQTTQIETNFLLQKPAKPISKNCLPADDISSLKTSVPFGYGYLYPAPSTSYKIPIYFRNRSNKNQWPNESDTFGQTEVYMHVLV